MRAWPIVLSVFAILPTVAAAQTIPGQAPTATECQNAATALAGGERDQTKWYLLSFCGAAGGTALGQAIRDARTETDLEYLRGLHATAAAIRDPEILAAAAEITRDHGAAVPARVAAAVVMANQINDGFVYSPHISWNDLLTSPQPCNTSALGHGGYNSRRQLQADSVGLIAGALDQVRYDETEGQLMRELAGCMRGKLQSWVPITVSPSSIGLTYVCGNQFRVENGNNEFVVTSFEVEGTNDRGDLAVNAWQNLYFTTRERGTVRLAYQGQVIRTVANEGTACP